MSVEVDNAWAAGLFEGEGCITLNGGRYARAQMNTTDEDVILKFAKIVGCGKVYGPYTYKQNAEWKPYWTWKASSKKDCIKLLARFEQYLGTRRVARFKEVLDLAISYSDRTA